MRIIAGSAKGRRLVAPRGDRVRPTTDRVKEALFSSLQPRLHDARVLDLYAGSGALGLEALSRGARNVVFVERWGRALAAIATNVAATGLGDRVTVIAEDVDRALGSLSGPFDVVLADPPYDLDHDGLRGVLEQVVGVLSDEAVVVVERARRDGPVPWPASLRPTWSRPYGDTTMHMATVERPDAQGDG